MLIKKGCNITKATLMAVFFLISFSFLNVSLCQAYTDDAGIIGGLDKTTPIYDYLNTYNYRLYLSDHRYSQHDMYINSDNAVLVSIWDDRLGAIYILKPGYATDKGIEVGMTLNMLMGKYILIIIICNMIGLENIIILRKMTTIKIILDMII